MPCCGVACYAVAPCAVPCDAAFVLFSKAILSEIWGGVWRRPKSVSKGSPFSDLGLDLARARISWEGLRRPRGSRKRHCKSFGAKGALGPILFCTGPESPFPPCGPASQDEPSLNVPQTVLALRGSHGVAIEWGYGSLPSPVARAWALKCYKLQYKVDVTFATLQPNGPFFIFAVNYNTKSFFPLRCRLGSPSAQIAYTRILRGTPQNGFRP